MARLRRRQRLGKYIIEGFVAEGGFAKVYRARDTIEGIRVALKIPHAEYINRESLELFKREVRLSARLDHPNILPLKYADFIEGQFVVVTPLGIETLANRLQRRLAMMKRVDFARQMLEAVAWAHTHRIVHCDIKPDNFLIFPHDVIRLTDFGIAMVAHRTVKGSGSGTVGYIAPEQALGKPSMRSDVFSLGLICHLMFAGSLPDWPYEWPTPGYRRLASCLHPDFIELIRRAMQVHSTKRFASAEEMLAAFERIPKKLRVKSTGCGRPKKTTKTWRSVRFKEFQRKFGRQLGTQFVCKSCQGPISETMLACPWCGKSKKTFAYETDFPEKCPRCLRGMKCDWRYCPWCRGGGFEVTTTKEHADRRYSAKCQNPQCGRKLLMPFMRYCPWCNRKVSRKWRITGCREKCSRCKWGIASEYWSFCPWCSKEIRGSKR